MATSHSSRRPPLARYVNYFEVGHNAYEFLVDFGQYQPETEGVVLHTRIALGPTHAKLLTSMLSKALECHETEHGPVAAPDDSVDPFEVVLRSLPDFERRAVDARRAGAGTSTAPNGKRTTAKR
jgi:hypothetical protein